MSAHPAFYLVALQIENGQVAGVDYQWFLNGDLGDSATLIQVCRQCGCDDLHACEHLGQPCSWVEPHVCSACAQKSRLIETYRPAAA